MAIIHDMVNKTKEWGKTVTVYAPAEKLICRLCKKEYVSRGKDDPGICRECELEENAHCIGGTYDGEPAHDKR